MRISILAIGQDRSGPEAELCDGYLDRAARQGRQIGLTGARIRCYGESKLKRASDRKADESGRLLGAAGERARLVALSERGAQLSSRELAQWLARELRDGTGEVAFLIGGPDGHDETLEDEVHMKLSLGVMTWPHRLVRVMLAEQVYRSVTILTKHPYHRA